MSMFLEKRAQYFVSLIAVALVFFLKIQAADFENYKDILASCINISAITAGFLATAMSLLVSLTNDDVIGRLKKFGLYTLLVGYLKSAIGWTFIISLISAAGLFFNKGSNTDVFFYIWIFVCFTGIFSVVRVVRILSKILDKMSD